MRGRHRLSTTVSKTPETFPRLLVATEFPPNASGGGASVVRQMLKDWPVEKLYWWSCNPDNDSRFGQRVAAHRVAKIPPKCYPNRKFTRQKSWFLENIWSIWAARHFRKTVAVFRPDVIWFIPVTWAISSAAKALLEEGIGFHVTVQDYPDCKDWVKPLGLARTKRLATLSDELYAKATTRDATSHPMIEDLRLRTGCDAMQMMHAGLEKDHFDVLRAKTGTREGPIRIAFAGTISREDDFAKFVSSVDRIRPNLSKPVTLEIFSSHRYSDRSWFDPSWMHERGNLGEPQFTNALRECTWGFSMLSLAEDDTKQRMSFPTKFISYLAAGLPVFTLGHPESSVVRMAQQYRVGICVTSGDPNVLDLKVGEALSCANPWQQFGSEILNCAKNEFDASKKREVLYKCFQTCIQESFGRGKAKDT